MAIVICTAPGEVQDPDGKVIWGGNIVLKLPDSDPAVDGALYLNSDVVTVSTGP